MVLPCSDRDATGRNSLCWELASHCTANSRSTPNSFCRNEDVRQQLCNFRATIAIGEYASVDPAARQRATEMGSKQSRWGATARSLLRHAGGFLFVPSTILQCGQEGGAFHRKEPPSRH